MASAFKSFETAPDAHSSSVGYAVNGHINVRIPVLHEDRRRGCQLHGDSTAFINPTPRTVQVTEAYPYFSDPSGKALQREIKPPLNMASQSFGDRHALPVNIKLHSPAPNPSCCRDASMLAVRRQHLTRRWSSVLVARWVCRLSSHQ